MKNKINKQVFPSLPERENFLVPCYNGKGCLVEFAQSWKMFAHVDLTDSESS